jgi:hypothetical protein
MSVIGLVGVARSGKDTLAGHLQNIFNEKYDRHFKLMAFADVLKKMCQKHFDLSIEQLWGNAKEIPDKKYKKMGLDEYWTPREIMQEIGEFYRKIDYDFWVKTLSKNIVDEDVLITDVRYINEADFVRENKGFLIKVVRDADNKIHGSDHGSETGLDNYYGFDLVITNNGTLDDLKDAAVNIAGVLISLEKLSEKGRII